MKTLRTEWYKQTKDYWIQSPTECCGKKIQYNLT